MNLIEVLSTQRKGKTLLEAQEALQSLILACQTTGKKGSLILKLDFEPGVEDGTVHLSDDLIVRKPKPTKPSVTYYSDEQGALYRDDPRQPELPAIANITTLAQANS